MLGGTLENLGEISPDQIDETAIEDESNPEKPDFVKKIESFDVNNLTPENIEFMTKTIQDYFLEHFQAKSELVEKIPDYITLLNPDEFRDKMGSDAEIVDPESMTGFYSPDYEKIFINKSVHDTPEALFSTLFHESLHLVSIEAGAGFDGEFLHPDEFNKNDPQIYTGINTLSEGTTQLFTLHNVIDNLGFNEDETMFGYAPAWRIMEEIWAPFSTDEKMQAYFEMSMEDLRIHIEKIFEPDETRDEINENTSNGIFINCLKNLGIATENITKAMEDRDSAEVEAILKSVRRATGAYIIQDCRINHKELSQEDREKFREYLEPYKESTLKFGQATSTALQISNILNI